MSGTLARYTGSSFLNPLFPARRIYAPGPTMAPLEVLQRLAQPPLHHRTPEFGEMLGRVRENLQLVFRTTQPCYVFSSSGTGALEACMVNLLSPQDEMLVLNGGKFGERWAELGQAFGCRVHMLEVPWGSVPDPQVLRDTLKKNPNVHSVWMQACETSTTVCYPIRELASVVHEASNALVIVDAVSSLGADPLEMDAWGIDAMVSGSQKALMLPPGLSFLALSPAARARSESSRLPRFYFDLKREDAALQTGETAFTTSVSLVAALDLVLTEIKRIGMEALWEHHARLAGAFRSGAKAMGLSFYAQSHPSNVVTGLLGPAALPNTSDLIRYARDAFQLTLAEGQGKAKGKMFRVAHVGSMDSLDTIGMLSALEMALHRCTQGAFPTQLGLSTAAAMGEFL